MIKHEWRNIDGEIMELTDEAAFNMSIITMGKGLSPEENRQVAEMIPWFDKFEDMKRAYLASIHENWFDDMLDDPRSAESFFEVLKKTKDGQIDLITRIKPDELEKLGSWYCKCYYPDLYEMATFEDFADLVPFEYNDFYDGECLKIEFDFEAYGQKLLDDYKVVNTEWGFLVA